MIAMWLSASLLVWAMVPNFSFLHSLAVGACVTPTDPILSNSIVKGKFADKNIPKSLQRIIIAESGANDGLGYPFLFFALYIIKHVMNGGERGAGKAMEQWFVETWVYTIILSIVYGVVVGWLAKELLHYAEQRKFVDRESFLVFALTLALFIVGTCGMIGSDDVLACFIAGNVFTWDDWFRLETEDDSLQPTIDMLLNISVFAWFGSVCPWVLFRVNDHIPLYRLVALGILILLFRRVPVVMLMWKRIPQIEDVQQALFVGFFGPIGVSAIFYLYISLEFLNHLKVDGEVREDAARLGEVMTVVIWFLAICSIVVHGLSVPMGKLGYHLPRTMSQALSTSQENDLDEPHIFLRHFQRQKSGDPSFQMRRRKNNDRRPSSGAFQVGGSNPRMGGDGDVDMDEQSAAEPLRPIRYPGTEQNTSTRTSLVPTGEFSEVISQDTVVLDKGVDGSIAKRESS